MKNLAVSLLIDRSGSMADKNQWPKTISACNEYIKGLAGDENIDALITVTSFDSGSIDVVRDSKPVKDCAPLQEDEFPPRGMTPLLDAVGRAIEKLELRQQRDDEGVALVVMTDGLENASSDYTYSRIKEILKQKQDDDKWLVIFLGQGVEAWGEGDKIGTYAANTVQYAGANVQRAMQLASAATMDFMETGNNDVGATFAAHLDELKEEEGTGGAPPKKKDEPKRASLKRW